ncbi:MAG: MFS transporter [Anaerolineae bacterium]
MLKPVILYGFPFAADVIVSLVLFVGRHALAGLGYGEATVGSIVLFYGIGYVIASLLMTRVINPRVVKEQMLASLVGIVVICLLLANVTYLRLIQALYALFPFVISLFFNAFQIFMLGVSNEDAKPLATTAGHFVFAWSIGFAAGPFISSLMKASLAWAQIYYAAAALAVVMSVLLLSFRPRPAPDESTAPTEDTSPSLGEAPQSLIGAAWVGLLFGWTAWNAALIYWPIQAVRLGLPTQVKGLMETGGALTQGVAALALTYLDGWHRRPGFLAVFGALGVVSLGLLSGFSHVVTFGIAAILYGIYTASMFSFLVYHGMVDERKAVKRVALGETIVGICFLLSSPVANLLHGDGRPFGRSYLLLAVVLAVGTAVQTLYARTLARDRAAAPEAA